MDRARSLSRSAARDEASGELARAYGKRLEAWNLARAHPEVPGASTLAGSLKGDLDRLRGLLNEAGKASLAEKTIRVK